MNEPSDHPDSEDHGRTGQPDIQQQSGNSRSPAPGTAPQVVEIGSRKRDILMDPNSDTNNDAEPSGNDDLSADESEREENERRGKGKGKGKGKRKEDDSTQYSGFQTRHGLTNQSSFPVSENSVECHRFNKSLPSLIECLGRSNTKWVSIDCLGRRWSLENKQSKIRTTVVISFSQYPDRAEELKRDLQMAMKDNGLPIEFIQGRVTRHVTNPFGLLEPQNPLVCGSSCGPHGLSKAGTIGGFITINGDPDPNAVYAVTNHHVVARDHDDKKKIPWMTGQNIESHLGLTEYQSEDLADLSLNRYDRAGIHDILTHLGPLEPPPKGMYGDDRKTYLHDFVEQALKYWNKHHPDNLIRQERRRWILGLVNGELSNFNVPDQRTHHRQRFRSAITDNGLDDLETHIMEDMRWFLKLHYYELQIPLQIIQSLPELNGRGAELFADVIRTRRLQRERPKLSRIIEHPAKMDSESVIERINKLLHPPDGELPVLQEDTEPLRQNRQRVRDHMRSANRLIGTVWASSGLERRPRRQGRLPPLVEDWALIKLFRNDGQQFQNRFGANLLRPRFPAQSFTGVRELPSAARIAVTKRGSTTDLTGGTTNGAPSVIHEDGYLQSTFTIVATPHTTQFFSASGDSGSWIMDRTGQLVGMMWGGRNKFLPAGQKEEISGDLARYTPEDLDVEDVTYFTTAKYIFRWIEESFKEWRRILGEEQPQHFERKVRLFS